MRAKKCLTPRNPSRFKGRPGAIEGHIQGGRGCGERGSLASSNLIHAPFPKSFFAHLPSPPIIARPLFFSRPYSLHIFRILGWDEDFFLLLSSTLFRDPPSFLSIAAHLWRPFAAASSPGSPAKFSAAPDAAPSARGNGENEGKAGSVVVLFRPWQPRRYQEDQAHGRRRRYRAFAYRWLQRHRSVSRIRLRKLVYLAHFSL